MPSDRNTRPKVKVCTFHLFRVTGVWRHVVVSVWLPKELRDEVLGPHDAVDGLGGRVADGAAGEGLGGRGRGALIALTVPLQGGEGRAREFGPCLLLYQEFGGNLGGPTQG